ncbi:MAG: Gfo/Idh/MocA family oxidoreductase [Bacteroidota bacterium]|nr:Gfo/Idh/MocA family oxidoreductase [Bacteroidota bacterium]
MNYKWGIIGPGKIANKFAAALELTEGAVLQAVASRDAERAREFAARFGAPRHYGSYEELASDPSIDLVYIATPHGYHCEHARLCLANGKAVLCEKPMALSNRQVQAMIGVARANQCLLMEAMWTRFLPIMERVTGLIGEGQLGAIRHVRADFGFKAPFNPEGRLYNLRLGGGSLLDIGIYPLFLCLFLLGEPDELLASAHLAPTGADETCQALFQYRDGRSAAIHSTLACQTSITAEIAGTEGMIRIPTPWYKNDRFLLERTGEEPRSFDLTPMVNGFEYQIREMMSCLDRGLTESPRMPHSLSLAMSRVMDKIRGQCGIRYPGE